MAFCCDWLGAFKEPAVVLMLAELPKGRSRKIQGLNQAGGLKQTRVSETCAGYEPTNDAQNLLKLAKTKEIYT